MAYIDYGKNGGKGKKISREKFNLVKNGSISDSLKRFEAKKIKNIMKLRN